MLRLYGGRLANESLNLTCVTIWKSTFNPRNTGSDVRALTLSLILKSMEHLNELKFKNVSKVRLQNLNDARTRSSAIVGEIAILCKIIKNYFQYHRSCALQVQSTMTRTFWPRQQQQMIIYISQNEKTTTKYTSTDSTKVKCEWIPSKKVLRL